MAAAGLPAMFLALQPRLAQAQYYVGQDGHALDNNNRVGSGGSNGPSRANAIFEQLQRNDAIVTGNVTGLNYFHGNVASFDSNTLQGRTPGGFFSGYVSPSDRLNAISAPVSYRAPDGTPTYTTYYDASRYTAPIPQNMTVAQNGATLLPAPTVDPMVPSTDLRLTNLLDPTKGNLPLPGELNVVGPVDPTAAASLYSMSPLYGVRPTQGANSNSANGSFLQQGETNSQLYSPMQRSRMTPGQIAQMRDELNKTVVPSAENPSASSGTATPGSALQAPLTPQPISNQLPQQNLAVGAAENPGTSLVPAPNDQSTGQSLQNSLLIPANKQSKQLKALEDKYSKLNRKLTDQEAAEKLNAEERLLHSVNPNAKTPTKPGQPTETPGATPVPGAGGTVPAAGGVHEGAATQPAAIKPILPPDSAADNQPYVVTSLASGIQARGLSDLMKSAEDKMRQGKFTEAVDTYESAQAVAPNNPLIALGRSFAELGASYYGKSDQDLTRAVAAEPALLAGKYDLNGLLGEDRVKFVMKDLLDIANHEKSGRPLVLLGFMAHNTGDDEAAARYLNQAAPRGGYESMITLMRSTWGLKAEAK
jgi:hypothetical protein